MAGGLFNPGSGDGGGLPIGGSVGQVLVNDGPGSGSWQDDIDQINASFDGGGSAIITGTQAVVVVEYDCTVLAWTVLALGVSGAIQVDVWKDTYANHPPTDADAMPGAGNEPRIVATNNKGQDTDASEWTTNDIAAGSILIFNVDSCTSITRTYVSLIVRRT